MIREHGRIVLLKNIPNEGLQAGDVGTVVHIYKEDNAYEIEFMTLNGNTVTVVTLLSTEVRVVTENDISHVRERAAAF